MAPNGVCIYLLGSFSVRVDVYAIDETAWRLRKARGLIQLLTLSPGHRLHRERVVAALWPDLPPEPAFNNLHQTMHSARRALSSRIAMTARTHGLNGTADRPSGPLTIHDHIVTFDPPLSLWIDVEAFERLAERALGTADIRAHEAAIRLYAGELLPDNKYDEWTVERREALTRQYLNLLSELAELYEQGGDWLQAADTLRRLLAADSTVEDAHARLMRLYALTGQRWEALRQFDSLLRALRNLDIVPQPASIKLYQSILACELAPLGSRG